jgi:hypothetical protein
MARAIGMTAMRNRGSFRRMRNDAMIATTT